MFPRILHVPGAPGKILAFSLRSYANNFREKESSLWPAEIMQPVKFSIWIKSIYATLAQKAPGLTGIIVFICSSSPTLSRYEVLSIQKDGGELFAEGVIYSKCFLSLLWGYVSSTQVNYVTRSQALYL